METKQILPKFINIEITRGDLVPLVFSLLDSNGNMLTLTENDEIYFTMKKNRRKKEYIFQKKYSNDDIEIDESGVCKLAIEANDTAEMKYGSYVYDICFKSGDYVRTLVYGNVILTDEATHKSNE